ncbi:hypothetical protein [Mycobacterium sp.]|uniref:hypothetical protein n=1 Tax=Mycobacterium sp. TaxID=1785 RepID=UPI00128A7479|nr:hypothetical protein [Mycobacterium sp.]KAA8963511.1 MAG: hypothetical protein F6Q13_10840 [Mycobacterium sp.]
MRFALRPYLIAGAAIAGASAIVAFPAAPELPSVEVPAVRPAGSELGGFSQQDLTGLLGSIEGMAPDVQGFTPASPAPSELPKPGLAPPDLGLLDPGRLDPGGVNLGTGPTPGNP